MKAEAWEDMAGVVKELAMNLRSLNANIARMNSIVSAGVSHTLHTVSLGCAAPVGHNTEGDGRNMEAPL